MLSRLLPEPIAPSCVMVINAYVAGVTAHVRLVSAVFLRRLSCNSFELTKNVRRVSTTSPSFLLSTRGVCAPRFATVQQKPAVDSPQSCPPDFHAGFALLTNTIPSFPLSGSDTIMQALGYECGAVTGADRWEMPRPHQTTARVLAAFGWQASPDTPVLAAPDGSDSGVLHCALCLRTCGSWNYAPPQALTSTSSKSTPQRKFLQL